MAGMQAHFPEATGWIRCNSSHNSKSLTGGMSTRTGGLQAHTFYMPEGLFAIGDKEMSGAAAVQSFYSWRRGRGERIARHVVTNFALVATEEGKATLECIMCLYAADGVAVLPSLPPIMIADIESVCHYGSQGWKYVSHRLVPLFMGGAEPTIPPDR